MIFRGQIFAIALFLLSCGQVEAKAISKKITCGQTRFWALTHVLESSYVIDQHIIAISSKTKHTRAVDLRQHSFILRHGKPGLKLVADVVHFWGCAKTPEGYVLILYYDCPQVLPDDVPIRFCSDSGEWYRFVASDGSLLDRGFGLGNADPRESALIRRLGLAGDDAFPDFESVF